MYTQFFQAIQDIDYIVQRNWDNLPKSCEVDEHKDIDLFVNENERAILEDIIAAFYLKNTIIDVRSQRDLYYPEEIGYDLLKFPRIFNGFIKIPNKQSHFISLYYHNVVHKKDNPYDEKLKEIFLSAYSPIRCIDKGVGYYIT